MRFSKTDWNVVAEVIEETAYVLKGELVFEDVVEIDTIEFGYVRIEDEDMDIVSLILPYPDEKFLTQADIQTIKTLAANGLYPTMFRLKTIDLSKVLNADRLGLLIRQTLLERIRFVEEQDALHTD